MDMCAEKVKRDMDETRVSIEAGGKVLDMSLGDFSRAARSIVEKVRIAPADDVGVAAVEALGDSGEMGLAERMVCAVLLEWGMRHGAYVVDMCRRELSKFLEDPDLELDKFQFEAGLKLCVRVLPGEHGFAFAPAVISKLGSAKVPMRSRNGVAVQLDMFAPAQGEE
jgi:hypothetical protein